MKTWMITLGLLTVASFASAQDSRLQSKEQGGQGGYTEPRCVQGNFMGS